MMSSSHDCCCYCCRCCLVKKGLFLWDDNVDKGGVDDDYSGLHGGIQTRVLYY